MTGAPNGYDITGIATFSGWRDGGRDNQEYAVLIATAGDPTMFNPLASVEFNPAGFGNPSDTAVFLANGGILAQNVVGIRFSFAGTENGYVGYREFDLFGQASPVIPEPATAVLALLGAAGLMLMVRRKRAAAA